MNIGLSFLLGLLSGVISYGWLGLWWPVAMAIGLFVWLAFGLLEVSMNSAFTILGGMLLAFSVTLSGILLSHEQIGGLQYAEAADSEGNPFRYPSPRPGNAHRGAAVYRANGCVQCHTQQVMQGNTLMDLAVSVPAGAGEKGGDAIDRMFRAIGQPEKAGNSAIYLDGVSHPIAFGLKPREAQLAQNILSAAGASLDVSVRFEGEDLAERGWGERRSVARDYIFDEPPLLGSVRLGPDLSNTGHRLAGKGRDWHLQHLLNPRLVKTDSKMPQYRYLFKKVKAEADGALENKVDQEGDGLWYKPTLDAEALVDYLLSLKGAMVGVEEAPLEVNFASVQSAKKQPAAAEKKDAAPAEEGPVPTSENDTTAEAPGQ